ncbi:glycosyltransferase [Crateriforma conspicua]|uniref:Putative teichuronic acid biosynthesis glycosyltransferase TuaC n=1 Tax=Crateriforma conspicua TaxID=2527996 RepID=A0A5C6FPG4_9PLAN|nr:glycosyltransferase [Crateriforma conspicua]TWU64819.1 putative teichuronic acid biosynthesis glycosyltransferase TuaC [Crateriforma conspicua]
MRINFVITELFVGGAEKCLTELAIGLHGSGDDVRVFSIAPLPQGPQAKFVERLAGHGIDIATAGTSQPRGVAKAYTTLKRWMSAGPADICQTFLFHANVLGTHASAAATPSTVRIGGLRVAEPIRWRNWLERTAVRRMDLLVCVSNQTQAFASEHLRAKASQLRVIPNGIDVARFADCQPADWSRWGWPRDSQVTLFVGRLHPQKGLDLLQDQIDTIAPAGSRQRLCLVGDGPLRDDLARWSESVGHDRVRVLPWQSDVAPLMKAARLLVLPSRYEGMPNVVLEAMAVGTPVVCSRVEGSQELLGHRHHEQTFAPEDAVTMARLIQRLQTDDELRQLLSGENRRVVQEQFSTVGMIEHYRQVYQDLLAARSRIR